MKSLFTGPPIRPLAFLVTPHTTHFLSLRPTTSVTCGRRSRRGWQMIHAQSLGGNHEYQQLQEQEVVVVVEEEEEEASLVEELRVPEHWMLPSKAKEESEWLRIALHKWLDDEYCPEKTNIEISKIAAQSFYNSQVENKDADIGVILLKMANDLQSINYQESFHGAFSSANAAMELVMQRLEEQAILH